MFPTERRYWDPTHFIYPMGDNSFPSNSKNRRTLLLILSLHIIDEGVRDGVQSGRGVSESFYVQACILFLTSDSFALVSW